MTIKLPSRKEVISFIRARALILVLVAGILLTACTSGSTTVVSQGPANATLAKPGNAESAMLADLHGMVEVKTGDGQWALAQSGQTLKSGQRIRTGALSNVMLTFYDDSRIYLGAEAEISLDALDAGTSGARVVQLTQVSGESRHEVAKSDDPGSRYDINTPAGSGSATGTKFTVMVLPNQLSQFWVDEGAVSVVNANITVVVVAGQTTVSLIGQPPTEPVFRVAGEGQVIQIETASSGGGDLLVWQPPTEPVFPVANEGQVIRTASGGRRLNVLPVAQGSQNDKITLCHATGSPTNPYVEITVSVEGATNGHAKHAGDIIPAPVGGCSKSTPPPSSTLTIWNIAGQTFHTGANTIIFGNPQPGDWVRFEGYQLSDGSRFLDRIVLVNHTFENQFEFIGKVEAIGATAWTISSRVVQVNEFTTIEAGLEVGDNVQVTGGIAADGIFRATRLNRAEDIGSNFWFAGILADISSDVWIISGIEVTVDENTALDGDFVVGHPVAVEGVIKEDGTWLAKSIDLVTPDGYHFDFAGVVQSLSPWIVSGVSFDTNNWTEIDVDIEIENKVRVTGVISADGIWVAERIERLDTEHLTSFNFFGRVLSLNPWNVRGILLTVDERTTIKGDITLGEMVKVTGWILADGSWLATEIKHTGLHLGQGCFMISSVVQSINGEQIILIDGQTLTRSEDLEVIGDLKEASLVRYEFCVDKDGVGKVWRIIVVYQNQYQYQLQEPSPASETESGKAVVCHAPPGNSGNRHTIEVAQSAVSAHMGHGDTLGTCPNE